MSRRLVILLAALGASAVIVGLSAAAARSTESTQVESPRESKAPPATVRQAVAGTQSQSSKDAAAYWTKERMARATPKHVIVRAAKVTRRTPEVGPSAAPSKPPTTSPKRATSKASAPSANGPVASSGTQSNGAGYWTQDAMDDATPPDMSIEGGNGSQSSSEQPTGVTPAGTP